MDLEAGRGTEAIQRRKKGEASDAFKGLFLIFESVES
jgi:hypothetical protein